MGSFFDQKAKQLGKKSAATVLRVSRFEDPVPTLELISHICSAPEAPSLKEHFKVYRDAVDEMKKESDKEEDKYEYACQFFDRLGVWGDFMQDDVEDGSYKSGGVKVAVAGGYSAGKSTFLNCITQSQKLLPTGIEPTSAVLTYVNCSSDNKSVAVRGENVAGNRVLLSPDVLESIRHTTAGQNSVAGVLKKLIVDIPALKDYMDGIVFIDTPGYDNSAANGIGDASSDKNKANVGIKDADFVLWCVDVQKGTVGKADLDILKERKEIGDDDDGGKGKKKRTPYALVVTKASLKPGADLVRVMLDMRKACVDRFGEDDAPAAVVCFDRTEAGYKFGALGGLTIKGLFDMIRAQRPQFCSEKDYLDVIRSDFDYEYENSKAFCMIEDTERMEAIKDRNSWQKKLKDVKDKWNMDYDDPSFVSLITEKVDFFANKVKTHKDNLEREEKFQSFLMKWRSRLVAKFAEAVDYAISARESFLQRLRPPQPMLVEGSVFDAIGGGDYQLFLKCFDKGVDLASTNSGGYNVLTYVAHVGDSSMMRFLVKHQADLSLADANGRDALAEAAACHFRDVCEQLLEADSSLAAGRKAELTQVANNDDFVKWLTEKL